MELVGRRTLHLIILIGLIACIIVVIPGGCSGSTITVDDDGGGDFTRIQNAINVSEEGDVIRVYEGLYRESLIINTSISLIGNGSDVSAIDGYEEVFSITITADRVNVSGFLISNRDSGSRDGGIRVESDHVRISQMNFTIRGRGVFVNQSRECSIVDNTFSSRYQTGIDLIGVDGFTIGNNNLSDTNHGIYVDESTNGTIIANSVSVRYWGILLDQCTATRVSHNSISSEWKHGIRLLDSNECLLEKNSMDGCGIHIAGDLDHRQSHAITTTNVVNGKPVHYVVDAVRYEVPQGAGQIIIVNCSRMTIRDQDCSNGSDGISISYSSEISVLNNTCSGNNYGIAIRSTPISRIENNICSWNEFDGISISGSINSTIKGNICDFNENWGIGVGPCEGSEVSNNSCTSNERGGINIYKSNNSLISRNSCTSNGVYGILIHQSSDCSLTENVCLGNYRGIQLYSNIRTKIVGNTCGNGSYGCDVEDSNEGIFQKNNCSSNLRSGFSPHSRSHNWTISDNLFHSNGVGLSLIFPRNCTIENNLCIGNTIGMYFRSSSNAVVSKNICMDNEKGVEFESVTNISFTDNTIANNSIGIIFQWRMQNILIHSNAIYDNYELGVNATKSSSWMIDISMNYWGDPSGPFHEESNPNGRGNGISGDVVFDPWMDKPEDPEPSFLPVYFLLYLCVVLMGTLVAVIRDIVKIDVQRKR